MRTISLLIILLTACIPSLAEIIADVDAANCYLQTHPCQRIEGLWQLSETDTKVLIKQEKNNYEIIIIESEDPELIPGDVFGTAKPTPEAGQYEMTLKAGKKRAVTCKAILADNDRAIYVNEAKKIGFRFTPRISIPAFWGHITISARQSNDSKRKGMTRLNPDLSNSQSIIYL